MRTWTQLPGWYEWDSHGSIQVHLWSLSIRITGKATCLVANGPMVMVVVDWWSRLPLATEVSLYLVPMCEPYLSDTAVATSEPKISRISPFPNKLMDSVWTHKTNSTNNTNDVKWVGSGWHMLAVSYIIPCLYCVQNNSLGWGDDSREQAESGGIIAWVTLEQWMDGNWEFWGDFCRFSWSELKHKKI